MSHLDQLFPPYLENIQNKEGNISNNVYSLSTSHFEDFDLDSHGEDTTNTSMTDDETISIPWDYYNISDSTVENYDSVVFDTNVTGYKDDDQEFIIHQEDMIEENDIPIIPKKDLDIVAHTFFMRKNEFENVSYPDPIETEESFYDCDQHNENTTYVTIMKVETLNLGKQVYEQTKICLHINNQNDKQHRNTKENIESMIHD